MMYRAYQAQVDVLEPFRMASRMASDIMSVSWPGLTDTAPARSLAAAAELFGRAHLSYKRPDFGIDRVTVGNREIEVVEEAAHRTPFGTLLHFKKDLQTAQPRVLIVAPMSGHFATLLRDTVRTMLADHDVYITDWHNARDIPLSKGTFGFGEFVAHLIEFLEVLGGGTHLLAVCQPSVAALAAVAIMAEDGNPAQPPSMTVMAGPIDTRINPTSVNHFATSRSYEWFEKNVIATVPWRFAGARRAVYPGFLQLTAFMSMNLDRHMKAFRELYANMSKGDRQKAAASWNFYEEYFAIMDLPAEFYLETIRAVFQEHHLPLGKLTLSGRQINMKAIRRTALLTVEGEKDDICAVGQTLAAQDLCPSIRPYMRRHHVQTGVGHYGVFSGKRWTGQIYPIVRDTIYVSE